MNSGDDSEFDIRNDPVLDNILLYSRSRYMNKEFLEFPKTTDHTYDDLPEFAKFIIDLAAISDKGTNDFIDKYLTVYLASEFVRRHTDGWVFLFIAREYIGAFETQEMAMEERKKHRGVYALIPMYFGLLK
jgi:hypothetical protein